MSLIGEMQSKGAKELPGIMKKGFIVTVNAVLCGFGLFLAGFILWSLACIVWVVIQFVRSMN